MSLARIMADDDAVRFMSQYFLKLPFAQPGGCRSLQPLGSWATVERILARPEVDVLVVRGGQRWSGTEVPTYAEARELHAQGYTIVLRHCERHDSQLAELAKGFRRDLAGVVDVQMYCTPRSQFGFGWHYDPEDVFILQAEGAKEYFLRKNTVHPWPLVETLEPDMRYEREIMPLMKCTLCAGDWLYVPCGYWHRAESTEDSISLAVGVLSTPAVDMFDFMRERLVSSLQWRQRLPTPGGASPLTFDELAEQYELLCRELGRDLWRLMSEPQFARDFLASKSRAAQLEVAANAPLRHN